MAATKNIEIKDIARIGFFGGIRNFFADKKINEWVIFYLLIYIVLLVKFITLKEMDNGAFFGIYSVAVSFYILSRFLLAYFYEPSHIKLNKNYEPTISFCIPAKNEERVIGETIMKAANSYYPKNKLDIIVVNDGSTDNTLSEIQKAQKVAKELGVGVNIINWEVNRGKREAMAECIKQSKSEIIVFVDSDSLVEPDAAKGLVKYFFDDRVGAVAGHAFVANSNKNMITKMQDARYFIAFKAYKGAESLFGSVTCCSGCCSAYRREYLLKILDEWQNQRFLGVKCTYGDDRSLTNSLLRRGYFTLYSPHAVSYTYVPDTFPKFMRQQLRWKKSWIRENLRAGTFMWKRNPIASLSFYLGVILPLLAPVIVVRALIWFPYTTGEVPMYYLFGLVIMAAIYGIYYHIHRRDKGWLYGMLFATFYTLILIWQLPYAILSLRDPKWGTR